MHTLSPELSLFLNQGTVIPAMPLALNEQRKLDERRQRALIRYYLDAGVGGLAVGVHTTQFEIRNPGIDLFEPVLQIAREELDVYAQKEGRPVLGIAGVIGQTSQAVREASLALSEGYHMCLLSLSAFPDASNQILLEHCRAVADILPVMGFYLQPAVGGRVLDVDFWREFAKIENVVAIKMAPFNRYQTLDVVRGVIESGRAEEIALYTGNDDNILADLLTEFEFKVGPKVMKKRIVGGLLGHWSVWTRSAVLLLRDIQNGKLSADTLRALKLGINITDSNAAFFDAANNFKGCIVGLHEVLRRQGLLEGVWTLDKEMDLTSSQRKEIDRVYSAYPDLQDDEFVAENLQKWLS